MNNENRNEEAVSPVIATILMVAITVVLAGVLYVWASSLAGDSAGGSLDTYTWNDKDAAGTMGDSTDDALIEVSMASGSALNWAVVKISISVDGGTPQACGDEGSCSFTTFESGNDKAWEAGEGITIMENGQDLCSGDDGGCEVVVTITKKGIGSEADKGIGTITGYADSLQ